MISAPNRDNEDESHAALMALEVLDTGPEAEFDALVRVASAVCGVPISLISLIDTDRQWFKANVGLTGVRETPRDAAFCAHAVLQDDLLEVADASQDARFADNPLVVGHPDIRFYAGAPIMLSSGHRVGTLCVIDRLPRQLDDMQRGVLVQLSIAAAQLLEGRKAIRRARQWAQTLADREADLRQVVNAVPSMLAYWHRDLTCRFANQAYETWFGVTPEALIGTHIRDLLGPELFALNKPYLDAALAGESQVFERAVPGPGGLVRHSLAHYMPDIVQGEVVGVLVQVSDVSHLKSVELAMRTEMAERVRTEKALRKSQDFLERTGSLAGVGGWEVDVVNGEVVWSAEVCRIHGQAPGFRPTLQEAIEFYAPASRPVIQDAVAKAMAGESNFDLELEIVRRDGESRWVHTVGSADLADGQPVRFSGAFRDVTEHRRMATELAQQHELLRITLQSIGDAVITTDALGNVVWLNPIAEKMTGWLADEAKGRPLTHVFHIVNQETRAPAESPLLACLGQGAASGLPKNTLLISRDGGELGIEDSAAPIRSESGDVVGAVLVFHDVSEQRRLSGEITYRATHDALTGLVNRAEFETRLQRALRQARQDHATHALLVIDLDQFKLVNDACGHAVGDQLLKQVGKQLGDVIRARDTLARVGGDEFAIILEHCSQEQAQRVAQKICDRMDDFRFVHEERRFRIGASIGLVPLDERWADTAAVQQAADASCFAAKEAGRNRVHVWFDTDASMRARQFEMRWTTRIEQALDVDGFVLFAQRIEDLRGTSAGIHAEVLLRMNSADGTFVQPGAFLPAAERFHLITRVDRWVLSHVIAWMQSLPDIELIDSLNVNLSGQSVGDRAFHGWAIEQLACAGPRVCAKLCLEITETAAVTNLADAANFIEKVRAAGVKVALDDFGAGVSSFGYLKNLPVDYLKIDGQFIRNLVSDSLDDVAVRCFIDVAKVVGVKTVAEFVETPVVLARLREIGVDFAQGYLIHQPEPIEYMLDTCRRATPIAE